MLKDEVLAFLDLFTEAVGGTGIDVSHYNLDHVAYQASSSQDYLEKSQEFLSISNLEHEATVGGRRVAVFKLSKPILYKDNTIIALEVIEPKDGQVVKSGWEHAEYVLNESFEKFMAKYSELDWDTSSVDRDVYSHLKLKLSNSLQVKFHQKDILATIALEAESHELLKEQK